jgi:hypothetical protein
MYSIETFYFTTIDPREAAVTIDSHVQGKEELLDRVARGLSFPDYFGRNWDALIDCLSDLSWSNAAEVTIDHSALPALPKRDLRLYLESLIDAAARRAADGKPPRLRFAFRISDRATVTAALAEQLETGP